MLNVVYLQGFIDALQDLLCDANPMVVANAVAALAEINEYSPSELLLFVCLLFVCCLLLLVVVS